MPLSRSDVTLWSDRPEVLTGVVITGSPSYSVLLCCRIEQKPRRNMEGRHSGLDHAPSQAGQEGIEGDTITKACLMRLNGSTRQQQGGGSKSRRPCSWASSLFSNSFPFLLMPSQGPMQPSEPCGALECLVPSPPHFVWGLSADLFFFLARSGARLRRKRASSSGLCQVPCRPRGPLPPQSANAGATRKGDGDF